MSESESANGVNTPIRFRRSGVSARATKGVPIAIIPKLRNSRRLKLDPHFWGIVTAQIAKLEGPDEVRFGS